MCNEMRETSLVMNNDVVIVYMFSVYEYPSLKAKYPLYETFGLYRSTDENDTHYIMQSTSCLDTSLYHYSKKSTGF